MRVVEITISNIKGVEDLTFKPKALTVLSGANGQGKSSVIDAIRAVFEGGHNPALVRLGQKKGEVVIVADNGVTIKRTITAKSSTLTVTDPEGNPVPKPQSYVDELASGFSFDPLGLMTAKPKDRAAFLLEAMPIEFSSQELLGEKGTGIIATEFSQMVPPGGLDLDGAAALRKALYEARTNANRSQEQAHNTVTTLTRGLPEEDGRDWNAEAALRQADLAKEKELRHARKIAVGEVLAAELVRIGEAEAVEILAIRNKYEAERTASRTMKDEAIKQLDRETSEMIERLSTEFTQAQERAAAQTKAAGAMETIEKMREAGREHGRRSVSLTTAIEKIDALKTAKLSALRIPGVEVRDGEIFVDDIPFDSLNTARQFELCFQIAAEKVGALGLMVCDRAESLDSETWEGFKAVAKGAGFQIVAARVGEGPLNVETAA